jgi:hypothetical protein
MTIAIHKQILGIAIGQVYTSLLSGPGLAVFLPFRKNSDKPIWMAGNWGSNLIIH